MKRKYLVFLIAAIVAGAILFGAGWLLRGSYNNSNETDIGAAGETGGTGEAGETGDRGNKGNRGKRELESFQNIELSVMSGDVTIAEGDTYSVEYSLHGREKVEKIEVENDTLYFDTGFDMHWKPTSGRWSVLITVPKGTKFETVNLKSTAGDISFSGYSFQDGTFITTSGDVTISAVDCKTLSVNTVSHDISLVDSTISDEATLDTVSGNIKVAAPFNSVQAKSVGNIKHNGADQGRKFSIDQGSPNLIAKSVSGEIIIDTE